jgi:hypothetical protein
MALPEREMTVRGTVDQFLKQNPSLLEKPTKEVVGFLMEQPELKSANPNTVRRSFHLLKEKHKPRKQEFWAEYNKKLGTYTIRAGKWLLRGVPAEEVQSWTSWYSDQGGHLTQSQIARESFKVYGRKLTAKRVGAILRALRVTKTSPPVAPHLAQQGATEETIQTVREAQEAAIEAKLRARDASHWRKQYETLRRRYWDVETLGDKITSSVQPSARSYPALDFDRTLNPHSPILFLCDWHVGQRFETPSGKFDKEVFRNRLHKLSGECHDWLRAYQRPLESLHIAVGGDIVDGVLPMRPQHNLDQDLHEGDQVEEASQGLAWLIESLQKRAEVPCFVWSVGGNHDRAGGDRGHDPNRIVFLGRTYTATWYFQHTSTPCRSVKSWT